MGVGWAQLPERTRVAIEMRLCGCGSTSSAAASSTAPVSGKGAIRKTSPLLLQMQPYALSNVVRSLGNMGARWLPPSSAGNPLNYEDASERESGVRDFTHAGTKLCTCSKSVLSCDIR